MAHEVPGTLLGPRNTEMKGVVPLLKKHRIPWGKEAVKETISTCPRWQALWEGGGRTTDALRLTAEGHSGATEFG